MRRILPADLNDPQVIELVYTHLTSARAETGSGSAHALDLSDLQSSDIDAWTLWDDDILLGIGALKQLSPEHGEVKSMHVVQSARRQGAGRMILRHIIASARIRGMAKLSLETGAWSYFSPARALYRSHGFITCPPFANYVDDPNSVFLSLDLTHIP